MCEQTSESDLLSNRYKKPVTSKAWWDNEEDVPARSFSKQEPGKSTSGASKSFLKQSKPAPSARLATPLESDEFDHQADEFRYGKPATVRFEDLDVDNIPRLSLDNSSVSSYQANKGETKMPQTSLESRTGLQLHFFFKS